MGRLSRKLREQNIEKLVGDIVPPAGEWENWVILGLPGCGVEEVFRGLVERVRVEVAKSEKGHLIELDFSSYWTGSVSQCVNAMLKMMPSAETEPVASIGRQEQPFTTLLAKLEETVETLAKSDWHFTFTFHHFDAVLRFSKQNQVQALLSTFQKLYSDPKYHAINIIHCYRNIEDIWEATNRSDYYRVFERNYRRVAARVSDKTLKKALSDASPNLSPPTIRQLVELSAGYPEHAEVLLRFVEDAGDMTLEQLALDALSLTFREWENSLSTTEIATLQFLRGGTPSDPEDYLGIQTLQRKGIVVKKGQRFRIASPLFDSFLADRTGQIDDKQQVFVRKAGHLNPLHRQMLERLFHGHYYIEWKLLQTPLPGGASVYLVTGEDQDGFLYRPSILKIDNAQRSAAENKNLEQARAMLGSIVPNLLRRHKIKGKEAVVLEYASADNKSYAVQQFAGFYRQRSAEEISDLLSQVMGQALYPFYRQQVCKPRAAKKLYFLPRVRRGEYEQIAKMAQQSRFYQQSDDTLRLPGIDAPLPNPGIYLRPPRQATPDDPYNRFFISKRPVGICLAHGDLNPRNLLIDGIGNIHLIDFSEMKPERARFMDFTRLEAEIKFKLTEVSSASLESFLALESLLIESSSAKQLERIKQLPLESWARKMVHTIIALRQTARSICHEKVNDLQFNVEYKLGLLCQTMRLSLFQDYLSQSQSELAVLSSALLIHRLDEYFSTNDL